VIGLVVAVPVIEPGVEVIVYEAALDTPVNVIEADSTPAVAVPIVGVAGGVDTSALIRHTG